MNELVVISGKGGTGKTSVVASFAALAEKVVMADCDVDAADLHLVLQPTILKRARFSGGSQARIMPGHCTGCGKCEELCRFDAIFYDGPGNGRVPKTFRVDPIACEGCGVCAWFCAEKAVEFAPAESGRWFISDTRHGPMVHAKLGVAAENSGKLVSLVRREAKTLAIKQSLDVVVIDGSPGIGCPVIAAVTGTDLVVIVTEPTLSGMHDLERVAELTGHFGIQTLVCVNKWDLNAELTAEMEARARQIGVEVVGRVRYDRAVTESQIGGQALVEYTKEGAAKDVRRLWSQVSEKLTASNPFAMR